MPDAAALLAWYDRHRRALPWRAKPGETPDPYRVWLSEIMLQQTTVATVIPYYEAFLNQFPSIAALAEADLADVLRAWAGLGYYARARNLHACAQAVVRGGGTFPQTEAALRMLPGIGAYTASAVAALAFGAATVPVDGNVERVAARVFGIAAPLPQAKPAIAAQAARLGEDLAAKRRPADFAQALFDLGATICSPTRPACGLCPWQKFCRARQLGISEALPRRAARLPRPVRHGAHFWLTDAQNRVLLRRRPPHGLLGGMTEFPGTPWREPAWNETDLLAHAPQPAAWRRIGQVRHVFTHFELRLELYAARVDQVRAATGFLHPVAGLADQALPSLMRKCAALAAGVAA
jgi:A/G-specific adenine glycosylase